MITGSGGTDVNATDGVADTAGADGIASIAWTGESTGTVAGSHGTLTVGTDGSYSYQLNNDDAAVQDLTDGEFLSETFGYTITDEDGDTSPADLVITINGTNDGVTITGIGVQGGDEMVDEADLPAGSSPDGSALTQSGTFDISALDGIDTVDVGSTTLSLAQLQNLGAANVTVSSAYGDLVLTGYSGTAAGGTVSYSYTLNVTVDNDSQAGATDAHFDDTFDVTVNDTDDDSDTATLTVCILDDVPTAASDADSVKEDDGPTVADGNVITGSGGSDANATDGVADTAGARTRTRSARLPFHPGGAGAGFRRSG